MGYTEQEIDIMQRCLDLTVTVGQGLQYLQKKFMGGQYEQGILMFSEVIDGCLAVERGMNSIEAKLADQSYLVSQENMIIALENTGEAASDQKWMQCTALLTEQLLPSYQTWQLAIKKVLEPAIVS